MHAERFRIRHVEVKGDIPFSSENLFYSFSPEKNTAWTSRHLLKYDEIRLFLHLASFFRNQVG
ncbi:hypothetical protein B8V81_3999 [Paenibacillus pasadenensis]|uniref:Uncharacterized protein n=1 Tax=Paenibacillus pasadenensis TaxID=217090 RepID=A0A2N5N5F1_9BACL|nr:hypothetical protein B8V81_3999 [Paenibacillus pasadenensis]